MFSRLLELLKPDDYFKGRFLFEDLVYIDVIPSDAMRSPVGLQVLTRFFSFMEPVSTSARYSHLLS